MLSQQLSLRMILNRLDKLGSAALALTLAVSLSGCDPPKPASVATPASQAFAPALTAPAREQAPEPPVQPTPSQQRVQTLIKEVEKAYSLGEAAYKRGNLPEARSNFDKAVDLMLTSGIDIKSTQPLQDEFDRIIDQINSLEMEALKQGNGFTPKTEDTPAEAANDVTFVVDPNIVAKANADLATTKSDLPLVVNDYVAVLHQLLRQYHQGPQHPASLLPARRALSVHDSTRHERRRRSAGSHLPSRC